MYMNPNELYEFISQLSNEEKMTHILIGLIFIANELKSKS